MTDGGTLRVHHTNHDGSSQITSYAPGWEYHVYPETGALVVIDADGYTTIYSQRCWLSIEQRPHLA